MNKEVMRFPAWREVGEPDAQSGVSQEVAEARAQYEGEWMRRTFHGNPSRNAPQDCRVYWDWEGHISYVGEGPSPTFYRLNVDRGCVEIGRMVHGPTEEDPAEFEWRRAPSVLTGAVQCFTNFKNRRPLLSDTLVNCP